MPSVHELQNLNFALLSPLDKMAIKVQGRPMPALEMQQLNKYKSTVYKRVFSPNFYLTNEWICGCDRVMAFFCFPCILFGGEDAWTKNGVTDLKHLTAKIKKHQVSTKHLRNTVNLAMLGKEGHAVAETYSRIQTSIKRPRSPSPPPMEKACEMKVPLRRIIECFKVAGSYEVSIGNSEDDLDDSEDPLVKLLLFCMELDDGLRAQVELIKAMSVLDIARICKEVHLSIYKMCKKRIREEVDRSSFFAIIISENLDVNENAAFSMVLRYELEGQVLERFWCFFSPAEAEDLARCILNELNGLLLGAKERLIAQSYDGAASLMGFNLDLSRSIQAYYPYAYLVPCYAHPLTQVVEQVVSKNPEIRNFFAEVAQISEYFSASPHRQDALDAIIARTMALGPEMRWTVKTVNDIFERKEELLECLATLSSFGASSRMTLNGALRIQSLLLDVKFNFLLSFFHQVFIHVEFLDHELQANVGEILSNRESLQSFEMNIEALKTSLHCGDMNDDSRAMEGAAELLNTAAGLCDVVIHQVKILHEFQGHTVLAKMLMPNHLSSGVISTEEWEFLHAYPMMDKDRLRSQLDVLFSRAEFAKVSGPLQLLQALYRHGVVPSFSEVVSAARILLTAPAITAELGRCFPTLHKVNSILRLNRPLTDTALLAARTALSLERELIDEDPAFVDKVIINFLMLNKLKKFRGSTEQNGDSSPSQ